MEDQALSVPPELSQARQALAQHDQQPTVTLLRAALASLAAVDLLAPPQPQQRLSLRQQVLHTWLGLAQRLDASLDRLAQEPGGPAASAAERNRLAWQLDALDKAMVEGLLGFLAQYYTPAPVDLAELRSAAEAARLRADRRAQLGL